MVTRAYFAQRSVFFCPVASGRLCWVELINCRDFTQTEIIEDFYNSLESTLEGKAGEGAIYMGTWQSRSQSDRTCADNV